MTSLEKTGTFASVALVCAQPLVVAVFSALLLHEPIHRRAVPGAVTAMAGAVGIGLLSATGRGGDLLGDLLAFSGAVTMAGHWLCGRAVRRHAPAMGYLVFVYGCTALLLAAMLPLLGGFAAPASSLPPIGVLIAGWTLGVPAVFTYALGFVRADLISFALLGEPIGAATWAWLLFDESVGWQMMLGGGLVLAGLAWYLLSVRRVSLSAREGEVSS
jgi:drug/metabolite transporter (DMT)-like permease